MRRRTSATSPYGPRGTLALAGALMLAAAALPLSRAQAQQQDQHGQTGGRQQLEAMCGDTADSSYMAVQVEQNAAIFADSEYADFRTSHGIATVPTDAPREWVRDPKVCLRLRPAVLQALRTVYSDPVRLEDYDLMFFRVGDYYAVSAAPKLPAGMVVNAYSPIFIFRAATLEYLGKIWG